MGPAVGIHLKYSSIQISHVSYVTRIIIRLNMLNVVTLWVNTYNVIVGIFNGG